MRKKLALTLTTAVLGVATAYPSFAVAEENVEGKVVSTKLTACDFNRGCEGYLTLEPKAAAKSEPINIRVVLETSIRKGNERVYLPALRGNVVAVTYVPGNGEKLAKSIQVVQGK